jgi:hypothetical protein
MEGVLSVQQLDDRRQHWHTRIGGRDHEFDVEITEQLPDQQPGEVFPAQSTAVS